MALFRMEVFVEGRHLERALTALTGVAVDIKTPTPVVMQTAEIKKNGEIVAAASNATNGELLSLFEKYLLKNGLATIKIDTARAFLQSIGQSPDRASYLMTRARETNLLKKKAGQAKGFGVQWIVVPAKRIK